MKDDPIIFLDIDGVIGNFSKSFAKRAGLKYPVKSFMEFGWFQSQPNANKEIWQFGFDMDYDFWVNIEPYPWAMDMINLIEKYDKNFRFLTACTKDSGCFSGKFDWVKKNIGSRYTKKLILVTSDKSFASSKNRIIIDDKKQNCRDWASQGGSYYRWQERTDDMIEESEKELIVLDSILNKETQKDGFIKEYFDLFKKSY